MADWQVKLRSRVFEARLGKDRFPLRFDPGVALTTEVVREAFRICREVCPLVNGVQRQEGGSVLVVTVGALDPNPPAGLERHAIPIVGVQPLRLTDVRWHRATAFIQSYTETNVPG